LKSSTIGLLYFELKVFTGSYVVVYYYSYLDSGVILLQSV